MADSVSSPLSFRDFIRHLLPTATALCLFLPLVPFTKGKLEVGALVFAAVVLGYLVTTPLNSLLATFYSAIPVMKILNRRRRWAENNWDLNKVFYAVSQEEREYLYMTASYIDMYRQLSFYLLIYALVNLTLLLHAIRGAVDFDSFALKVGDARTMVPGNFAFATILLFPFSIIVAYHLFRDFILEYEIYFCDGGQYFTFAQKAQEKEGGFATGISGVVRHNKKPWYGSKIELLDSADHSLETVDLDPDGYFWFDNTSGTYSPGPYKLRLAGSQEVSKIETTPKQVPLRIETSLAPAGRLKWSKRLNVMLGSIISFLLFYFLLIPERSLIALFTSATLPFGVFLLIFRFKWKKLEDPALSALILASVPLAITALVLSSLTFWSGVDKSFRWTHHVIPFVIDRWPTLVAVSMVGFLFSLTKGATLEMDEAHAAVSDPRLPKLEPGTHLEFLADYDQDREYNVTLKGANLQNVILSIPQNSIGKLEMPNPSAATDANGTLAEFKLKVLKGSTEGAYELLINLKDLPKVPVTIKMQPVPVCDELLYGPDEKGTAPIAMAADQQIEITIRGKNLDEANIIPPAGFTVTEAQSSPDKLFARVKIQGGTPANPDYTFQIKNRNPIPTPFKFPLKES
jgi:hypothetical protein